MRVRNMDVGLEIVSRRRIDDDVHLPRTERLAPAFVPQQSMLDEILRRPSLDQRLVALTQPRSVDSDLLEPATMGRTRLECRNVFRRGSAMHRAAGGGLFARAAEILDQEIVRDEEVREAIAALLKG